MINKRKGIKSNRRKAKPNETPRPFADISLRDETDWTNQKFAPASPACMVPISPTSSPAMPVTKEKVQIPGMSCSPLSPLPQGFLECARMDHTPPPYITLDNMPLQAAAFDVKLQAFNVASADPKARGMGSLASFHNARNGRQVELQFAMGMVGFAPQQRKDPKQLQDAIQEQMIQLKKLTAQDDSFGGMDVDVEMASAPQQQQQQQQSQRQQNHQISAAVHEQKKEKAVAAKAFETPGTPQTPGISANCSTAAFDASQLSLLQSYMKQSGGVVPF
eukprot:CAMPEP_0197532204 /NCGR_PEP_ID=MMETSP1318-20131121/38892_1 /TAXON_ID=552666 /ORGANISM="Partenskyella glossopodia, Strain RCC365" /LENGTH=275 /DNA_ID=CAMNT_0043088691 /DNA_START=27 /DNA_END=854 /DNA_ORIENTATION=+